MHITKVQQISKELNTKGINPNSRLKLLTKKTNWLMHDLYLDCLEYPKVIPYVKLLDGTPRIKLIQKEIKQREKKQMQVYNEFINTTAKDLLRIITKYILNNEKKEELLELLENYNVRHLASELDNIKDNVTKKDKEIIEDFYWSVF